jgi:hypothetical protein
MDETLLLIGTLPLHRLQALCFAQVHQPVRPMGTMTFALAAAQVSCRSGAHSMPGGLVGRTAGSSLQVPQDRHRGRAEGDG